MSQKAPSAIRCIKTVLTAKDRHRLLGQKAPSAIRCIKTREDGSLGNGGRSSQKAPSAIRCIKTK